MQQCETIFSVCLFLFLPIKEPEKACKKCLPAKIKVLISDQTSVFGCENIIKTH